MAIRYEIVEAQPLDIYLGVCRPCKRPKRETDTGYPRSAWADKHTATCIQCGGNVAMERVYGVEIGMQCDDRCMGATGTHCECACGGVNHGGIWSMSDEVLATALAAYRSTAEKREVNADKRKAQREADRLTAFQAWTETMPQKELVSYLREYWIRTQRGEESYVNPFLDSLCDWLKEHKPLTENQLNAGLRTMRRRQAAAERSKADSNGHLSNVGMVLGVFKYNDDIYVVKPNRKGTYSYAERLVPIKSDRMTESGKEVHFDREYAPGMLSKFTEDNRLTDEELRDWMVRYERCIVCGHGIKRVKSIASMMGPRCCEKIGRKWGE